MWIDYAEDKFTSRFRYVELMHYDNRIGRCYREPGVYDVQDVEGYRNKHRNVGVYETIWRYDSRDLATTTRLGNLYFDLDSTDLSGAQVETARLVEYLKGFIPEYGLRIYFTGKKGFHVECESQAVGISPGSDPSGLYRYIADELKRLLGLTTLDFSVYDSRRMWRIPNSCHQDTGLFKVEVGPLLFEPLEEILSYAREPHWDPVPRQEFSLSANQWFREWNYEHEERSFSLRDRINRFNRLGTSVIRPMSEEDLKFNPERLFEHCHALARLWEKAETSHHLEHEERLFLLSILSYNEEALSYLYTIVGLCEDFNPSKTQAHVDDWIRRRERGIGGRPYTCAKANAGGIGCGNCHLEPKERIIQVGDKLVSTGEFSDPSPIRYAYYRKDAGHEKIEYYGLGDI